MEEAAIPPEPAGDGPCHAAEEIGKSPPALFAAAKSTAHWEALIAEEEVAWSVRTATAGPEADCGARLAKLGRPVVRLLRAIATSVL